MGTIVTFYSYKGGVGRSMALANVAVLLARQGLKVLVVDWDLEAPGIERYFSYFEISAGGPGLLRLLVDAADRPARRYRSFTSQIHCETKHPITLLGSGRDQDPHYSRDLEAFDWSEFFARGGGAFIEGLRDQWRKDFDIVLVDSRTGLSDAGGVCTIQLPDIVVAMFTANYQSLYGVRDVLRLAQQARQKLAYDRMPLSILPLPSRWGTAEFQETRIWLDRVVDGVQEFFEDWLPRPLTAREVIESVKVPHHSYFGFGERMAVVEQGTSDPQGMGFVYAKVASFLASGMRELADLVGKDAYQKVIDYSLSSEKAPAVDSESLVARSRPDYAYDIFVSYERSASEWVHGLVDILRSYLDQSLGSRVRLFIDNHEVAAGIDYGEHIREAVGRSKVLLALLTPRYQSSAFALAEWELFRDRSREAGRSLLCPVLLRGQVPDFARETLVFDLSKALPSLNTSSPASAALHSRLAELSLQLTMMIRDAPPFDEAWVA